MQNSEIKSTSNQLMTKIKFDLVGLVTIAILFAIEQVVMASLKAERVMHTTTTLRFVHGFIAVACMVFLYNCFNAYNALKLELNK